VKEGERYRLDVDRPKSAGKVREYWGNVPQVVKAYAWARGMGAEGIQLASDISVVANNYMDMRLAQIPGLERSNPDIKAHRMEMTRWSLGPLTEETGVGTVDFANRMADYGIDPWWMSHEPWIVPEPFTPEAGELWSKEDIDLWIDVVAKIVEEARTEPGLRQVRAAQPAGCAGQGRGVRGPAAVGDDLARLQAQESRFAGRARRGLSVMREARSVGQDRDALQALGRR
jgi:glycine dehydrogenase subunit 2